MNKKLSRRNALRTGLGVTGALLLGNGAYASQSKSILDNIFTNVEDNYASIVKHGRTKGENLMVWSLMSITNVEAVSTEIENYRAATKYNSELKYSSNDIFKIDYAKSIIDFIAVSENINFSMVAFKDYKEIFSGLSPDNYQQRIINMYRELPSSGVSKVLFKKENLFGPSLEFTNAMLEVNGYSMEMTNPKSDSLIQINDFISGLVFSLLRSIAVTSESKLELISYFKEKMGLPAEVNIDSFKSTIIEIHQGNV